MFIIVIYLKMDFEFDSENYLNINNTRISELIPKIIKKFNIKTPFYLYRKKQLLKNFLSYKTSFNERFDTNVDISYSVKANFNPHLLKIFDLL